MPNIVIFGITGDLARRRIVPALARAWEGGGIPSNTHFFGFGRRHFELAEDQAKDPSSFLNFIVGHAPVSKASVFAEKWQYVESELDDTEGYKKLAELLSPSSKKYFKGSKVPQTFIYISLPPKHQALVIKKLISAQILKKHNGAVVALEKPFGEDVASAKKLNASLLSAVSENQIYRVDHYAAKEELMSIEERGKKGLYKDLNVASVGCIEIRFHEKGTAAGRGSFYDHVGALNDVGQNHIMHMLGTILAAPYASHKKYADIRAAAVSFLKLAPGEKPFFGQYNSFRKEQGVSPKSKTETYFRTENVLDFSGFKKVSASALGSISTISGIPKNILKDMAKRWHGLKVVISVGKALSEDLVDICFHGSEGAAESPICLVTSRHGSKDAYQTIFETAMHGDMSRAVAIGQILAGWKYVERVKRMEPKITLYKEGWKPSN